MLKLSEITTIGTKIPRIIFPSNKTVRYRCRHWQPSIVSESTKVLSTSDENKVQRIEKIGEETFITICNDMSFKDPNGSMVWMISLDDLIKKGLVEMPKTYSIFN